jgi:hypothetical protein
MACGFPDLKNKRPLRIAINYTARVEQSLGLLEINLRTKKLLTINSDQNNT